MVIGERAQITDSSNHWSGSQNARQVHAAQTRARFDRGGRIIVIIERRVIVRAHREIRVPIEHASLVTLLEPLSKRLRRSTRRRRTSWETGKGDSGRGRKEEGSKTSPPPFPYLPRRPSGPVRRVPGKAIHFRPRGRIT